MATNTKMSAAQRAAAVIVALGTENASKVYQYLREEEIEQLSLEVLKFDRIPSNDMEEIIKDFYGLCVTQKVIDEGGLDYAKEVLEKAFGAQQAAVLMERLSKSLRTKSFDFVRKADGKNLMAAIQNEHPQTIALLLSYARADQASQVISELPREKRIDVIERIAKLDRASPDIIDILERTLEKRFSSIVSVDLMELGGVRHVADIMNHADRGTEKSIFDELSNKDMQLATDVRNLMFVFEDIVYLDSISIQRFIRDVDTKDLAVALKAANLEVTSVIFQNMSKRMQESIRTDIEYLHNVRMRDVEEAQQRIVAAIRKLEDDGELVISKGGKDDIIV